jgi:hypothetical protein
VGQEPPRAFWDEAADDDDAESEGRTDEETQAPADRLADSVKQHVGEEGGAGGSDPPAAVDRKRDATADAGGDQLVDGRVDRRVFAADARAGQQAEDDEAPVVPGQP